jgi:hypothetical protein
MSEGVKRDLEQEEFGNTTEKRKKRVLLEAAC